MDSHNESVYRPRPEGSEMAPGGQSEGRGYDGGTIRAGTTALTRKKF